jgi:hypothetical protein
LLFNDLIGHQQSLFRDLDTHRPKRCNFRAGRGFMVRSEVCRPTSIRSGLAVPTLDFVALVGNGCFQRRANPARTLGSVQKNLGYGRMQARLPCFDDPRHPQKTSMDVLIVNREHAAVPDGPMQAKPPPVQALTLIRHQLAA